MRPISFEHVCAPSRGDRFAIALLATLVRPLIERCSPLPLALDRFATETLAALVFSAHMSLMRGICRWGDMFLSGMLVWRSRHARFARAKLERHACALLCQLSLSREYIQCLGVGKQARACLPRCGACLPFRMSRFGS